MTIYINAKCVDNAVTLDPHFYPFGQLAPLGLIQHRFSRKITIFRRRGNDMEMAGSRHTYSDLGEFFQDWNLSADSKVEALR